MKAIVYYSNGSPDVLKCEEIERPTPSGHEVLIRVRAAAMNPLDCGELMGLPYLARVLFGLHTPTKMHPGRPGMDLAGHVETVGAKLLISKQVTRCSASAPATRKPQE